VDHQERAIALTDLIKQSTDLDSARKRLFLDQILSTELHKIHIGLRAGILSACRQASQTMNITDQRKTLEKIMSVTLPVLIFKSTDHMENTTQPFRLFSHTTIERLGITYTRHSQSKTNHTQNSVILTISHVLTGEIIHKITDRYDSDSEWGTPIPGHERHHRFEIKLPGNDFFQLTMAVCAGDYKNYVSRITVIANPGPRPDLAVDIETH
jgi:hypothetical protein